MLSRQKGLVVYLFFLLLRLHGGFGSIDPMCLNINYDQYHQISCHLSCMDWYRVSLRFCRLFDMTDVAHFYCFGLGHRTCKNTVELN